MPNFGLGVFIPEKSKS